jgi:hypothetical protein
MAEEKKKRIPMKSEAAGHFNAGSDGLIQARAAASPNISNTGGDAPLKKNAGSGGLANVHSTPPPKTNPPPPPPPPPPPKKE